MHHVDVNVESSMLALWLWQAGSAVKLQKAQITLNDCLACSGCVTSAESVLISEQSQEELYRVLARNTQVRPMYNEAMLLRQNYRLTYKVVGVILL